MEIAIVTSPFGTLPPEGIGAVEKRWYNVGVAFTKEEHTVTFYCKKPQHEHVVIPRVGFKYIRGYGRTGRLLGDLVLDFIYSVRVLTRLKPCDILIINTFFVPILCPLFRRKFKVAVYNVARQPKGQLKFYKGVNRFSCVSNAVATAVKKQEPQISSRVKVINNPIDTDSFYYIPKEITGGQGNGLRRFNSACIGSEAATHTIGFSGRIHPEKGLDLLVKACSLLRDKGYRLHLRLIGPRSIAQGGGGDSYVATLDRLIEGSPIEWVDPISDASELAKELRKCDIYCYPSIAERGETFGVAPLEAMAVGCATVVSALECFQDFVNDGISALVFNHRVDNPAEQLAERIEYFLTNPDVRGKVATEGMQVTHTKFSNEHIAKQYLADFHSLLSDVK